MLTEFAGFNDGHAVAKAAIEIKVGAARLAQVGGLALQLNQLFKKKRLAAVTPHINSEFGLHCSISNSNL
jgi:hypothetical protein